MPCVCFVTVLHIFEQIHAQAIGFLEQRIDEQLWVVGGYIRLLGEYIRLADLSAIRLADIRVADKSAELRRNG